MRAPGEVGDPPDDLRDPLDDLRDPPDDLRDPPDDLRDPLDRARDLLDGARRIVVLTGAGISAESGVPTFRGAAGLWRSFRPEELATPEAFARNPRLGWEWYAWRRALLARCEPNAGHLAIARLAMREACDVVIVTQNVDGLHHRAAVQTGGAPDHRRAIPLELHGAIHRDRCAVCGVRTHGTEHVDVTDAATLPRCARCGGPVRPDVVWFGEALDPEVMEAAFDAARSADVCLVVGTSALVHPAAAVPEVTLRGGGVVVEVNLEPTPLTPLAAVSLRGAAGQILPALID